MKETETSICEKSIKKGKIEYRYLLYLTYGVGDVPLYSVSAEMIFGRRRSFYRTGRLFTNERLARRFFDKISKNLATPIDLPYIVEDDLTE